MKEAFEKWLAFAEEDLKMAELALKEKIYTQTCFHSQQCVEKVIKGYIEYQGSVPPKTHKLADLVQFIPGDSPFENIKKELVLLDRFYIPTRYPDAIPGSTSEGLPDEKDARSAFEIAKRAFTVARKIVKE